MLTRIVNAGGPRLSVTYETLFILILNSDQ